MFSKGREQSQCEGKTIVHVRVFSCPFCKNLEWVAKGRPLKKWSSSFTQAWKRSCRTWGFFFWPISTDEVPTENEGWKTTLFSFPNMNCLRLSCTMEDYEKKGTGALFNWTNGGWGGRGGAKFSEVTKGGFFCHCETATSSDELRSNCLWIVVLLTQSEEWHPAGQGTRLQRHLFGFLTQKTWIFSDGREKTTTSKTRTQLVFFF